MNYKQKIEIAQNNIIEWYEYWEGNVYVAFSGGKDSTCMLHLVRSIYPDVKAVFFNTGLEYPEIVQFVKTIENVQTVHPKKPFHKVINQFGYPVISKVVARRIHEVRGMRQNWTTLKNLNYFLTKFYSVGGNVSKKWQYLLCAPFKISNKCCDFLKKEPVITWQKSFENMPQPFIGIMASDSRNRRMSHIKFGCNAFKKSMPESRPIMSWDEQDVWHYIKSNNIKYSKIYDMGYRNTGCMFCLFGIHLDGRPNRIERMAQTHPKQYKYLMKKLNFGDILDYLNVPYPKIKTRKRVECLNPKIS